MYGFLESFRPLFARFKIEGLLLVCAFVIGFISIILFFQEKNTEKIVPVPSQKSETHTIMTEKTITIDVSGAVQKPFVYTLDSHHARIIDAIQKAGGLTDEADEAFVRRNINYARIVKDQEKIYIPFLSDTGNGLVLENKHVIDYTQPSEKFDDSSELRLMNINEASVIELDQLPGIGKVNAEAIFNGRPYTTTDDLVSNSIIKQSVYDKIKDQISVY